MEWAYPFFLLALPLGGPFLCPIASKKGTGLAYALTLGILLLATIAATAAVLRLPQHETPEIPVLPWEGGWASVRLDGLGAILALIGSGLCLASALASRPFDAVRTHGVRYLSSLLMLCSALNGIFLAGDLLLLAVFWELMVVSSYLLIIHHGGKALAAGRKYFVLSQTGAILLIVAMMVAFQQTGTTRIRPGLSFASGEAFAAFAFLAFVAFAIDAAIVPVHIWLPDAHSESPTPMSALLSGIVVKTGVYGIIRFFSVTYELPPGWPKVVVPLGLTTALVGVFVALFQMDGKRLIAFHTVSQIGIMVMGLGSASEIGLAGSLYHLISHSLFKSLLFLSAGWVMWSAGTRDLGKISVSASAMFPSYLVGMLSISGIPPFSGYFGKSLVAKSIEPGFPVLAALSSLVGMLTLLSFLKLGWFLFASRNIRRRIGTPSIVIAVTAALALVCILLGILAPLVLWGVDSWLGFRNVVTPVPSPLKATPTNILSYAGFVAALLIWSRRKAVYRFFSEGPLAFFKGLAEGELRLNEAYALGSRVVSGISRLSTRIATGNVADYMAYVALAWLGGALLIAGGLL